MIGKKFGMLTVVKDSGKRANDRGMIWKCICECGKSKDVSLKLLKNESKPRSCGCSRKIGPKKKFYSHIDKTGDCWEWTGTLTTNGYGKFRAMNASRVMWEYEYGNIDESMQVCHTCDNRKCCNPKHLFLGTISENMKDKTAKNRQAKGSKIGISVLDEEQVLNIRKMRLSGKMYKEISEFFGISFYLVRAICKNRTWNHVPLGKECSNFVSPTDHNKKQHEFPSD